MKPLLRQTSPLEDELLSSYLWRLAKLNHYTAPGWLWQLCEAPRVLHSGPNSRELLWTLSALTGQSVTALFDLTLHALAEHVTFEHGQFERAELEPGVTRTYADPDTLNRVLRSEGAVLWCPHCLEESRYFRKRWLAPLVAGCPEHGILLAHACPKCHQGVAVLEVLEGACRRCRASLAHPVLSGMKLKALEQRGQAFIHACLRGHSLERPSSWPQASGRALYQFLWGLALHRPEWPGLEPTRRRKLLPLLKRTTLETLYDVVHAFWVLEDWPGRLCSWLEASGPRSYDLAPQNTVITRWDRAWRRALPLWPEWVDGCWRGETFEWLQDALDHFLARRYSILPLTTSPRAQQRPAFILHLEHLRKEDLAFILNETQEMLEWLRRAGCIEDCWTREAAKKTCPEVLKLKTRLKRPLCLREVAQLLRLPLFTVVRLIEEQHLPFDFVSILDKEARVCWSEVKQVIVPLLERIEYGHKGVTLEQAGRMMGVFDLDEGPLLEAVLEGRINLQYLYQSEFSQGRVKGWAFSGETLEAFSRTWRRERGWLSLKETSLVFGIRPGVVRDWARDKLLLSVEGTLELWPHFEEEGVHDFARRFVSPSEAGRRLGVQAKQLRRWGEAGVLGSAYRPLKPHARWAWPLLEWEGLLEWWESRPLERLTCEAQRGSQARAGAKR